MARIQVHADRVVIELSRAEQALALRRKNIVIERAAITSALITDDPWIWLRGVRSPGTHIPGKVAFGTWRNLGGRDFVLARSKKRAVVIDIDADARQLAVDEQEEPYEFSAFSRVIISTAHSAELITALRLEGGSSEVHSTE